MKHLLFFSLLPALMLIAGCQSMIIPAERIELDDLANGRRVSGQEALARLENARIVLVGEHHTAASDHQAQLAVIRALHRSGIKVAIGLEMFRQNAQAELDRWVAGTLDEQAFEPVYLDNWNFSWSLYRPIFEYARQNAIPMVGLNLPPEMNRQVAYQGLDSLPQSLRASLPEIACAARPEYRDYVREAYDLHSHGHMNFENFCQAQLLWDTAMAVHASQYLQQHPDRLLVLLAGAGHVQKIGIPYQLDRLGRKPYVVLLPSRDEASEQEVTIEEADFLVLSR